MTRGRKKDLTIPPSRALAQQRDYRARKAKYVTDLEDRCRRAEQENLHLRQELELAKSGGSSNPAEQNPQMILASSDLAKSLNAAALSLARFQQLTFVDYNQPRSPESSALQPHASLLRPASFPSPAPSPPFFLPPISAFHTQPSKHPRTRSRSASPQPRRLPAIHGSRPGSPARMFDASTSDHGEPDDRTRKKQRSTTPSQLSDNRSIHSRSHSL